MSDPAKISIQIGSFPTLLTITFIVLKLCNVITWSWLWVLAPLWIPTVIILLGLVLIFALYVIYG